MGSDSDLGVFAEVGKILDEFGVSYDMTVASAHRSPDWVHELVTNAKSHGMKVMVAGAGGAAHLAGVVAAGTTLPVIGVPVESGALKGLDALLATAQMPAGIPVATVAINGAKNAGLLAIQMLALGDESLQKKLSDYKQKLADGVVAKAQKLENEGFKKYLEGQNG